MRTWLRPVRMWRSVMYAHPRYIAIGLQQDTGGNHACPLVKNLEHLFH